MPGTTGTPNADTVGLGGDLVAHGLDRLDGRTDEHDSRGFQRRGEFGVLREESVAGMNRLRPGAAGSVDDRVDVEIALSRGGGADADRDVRLGDVTGVGVGIAEHGYRTDAHLAQRADDAHGDLASVGDQDGVESRRRHGRHIRNTP